MRKGGWYSWKSGATAPHPDIGVQVVSGARSNEATECGVSRASGARAVLRVRRTSDNGGTGMTTLELLQEALYRLEDLEALSTPGEWGVAYPVEEDSEPTAHIFAGEAEVGSTGELEGWSYNADLIAAMHRTLHAQHDLLQDAIDWLTSNEDDDEASTLNLDSAIKAEIRLAHAILGR
jgi:hypothetical protein